MKTNKLLLVVATLAFCISASAAPYAVKGQLVSDADEMPEPFATIRIYHMPDTVKAVCVEASDEQGLFDISLPAAASYMIRIHSVGKKDGIGYFDVTAEEPVADLGVIRMVTGGNELAEVSVLAQRPLISKEIDRIAYDVKADDEAQTSTLREILRKVPMVTVEPDGTIKVNGTTGFKIYKNGRPNNSFSNNAKDIFAAIPASSIKRIEVITDPGAREDAEGIGAILNIVTDNNSQIHGVMGTVGASSKTNNLVPSPNLYLTSQIDKVTFSFYGGYRNISKRQQSNRQDTRGVYEETGNQVHSDTHYYSQSDAGWAGIEASYEPDTLNLFNIEIDSWIWQGNSVADASTTMSDKGGNNLYSYRKYSFYPLSRYFDLSASANYQHSFRRKGETLTFSYQISSTNQRQKQETDYSDLYNFPEPYTGCYSDFDLNFREQTFQLDYARPFGQNHKLDVGGKFVYRDNHSSNTRDYVGYQKLTDNFKHLTKIGALFADYRLTLGKWGLRTGLRYEYSHLKAEFVDTDRPSFGRHLNDWVPNAAVSFNASDASTWKFSYNRRISRPGINFLDPAVTETPTSWSAGNPKLESAVFDQFQLSYMLFKRKFNLNVSGSFSLTDNMIASIYWTEGNRSFSTYANAGRSRNFNLSLYSQWTITDKTSMMTNAEYNASWLSLPSAEGRIKASHPFNGSIMLRLNQKLPWKLQLTAYGYFFSLASQSVYDKNFVTSSNLFHGISLQRNFLKEERLRVQITAECPFGPYDRTFKAQTKFPGYTSTVWAHQSNFSAMTLSLSYRFGSLNASVKKTSSTISNDDLEGRKR